MFCIALQEEEKMGGEGGSELLLGLMDVEPVEPVIVRLGIMGLEVVLTSPDVLGHNITLDPEWRYTALIYM